MSNINYAGKQYKHVMTK